MDGWKSWKGSESWFFSAWYQRVRESYVAAWLFGVFQSSRTMSTSTSPSGGGVGGALSLMGCVREASPPPHTHHSHHHYHHHHQQQHRAFGLGEFSTVQHSIDPAPKGQYLSTLSMLFNVTYLCWKVFLEKVVRIIDLTREYNKYVCHNT